MEKRYEPHTIETAWYEKWEQNNYFAPQGSGDPYSIMLPPPNVTGSLHMGHAFQDTIMDALIRYHRMQGRNTLWQGGTDHAGIATQLVVENILARENKTRHDLGREKFIERVWEWKEESGDTIVGQFRRLGSSLDWSRWRFTMDPGLTDAVKKVFVTLHEEGIIYRGKRLVNWDPQLHTAISDLEVNSEEENGSMWTIRYPRTDGKGHIMVSTTRPETMLGDSAVAVNPKDSRYKDLVGKTVTLPLVGREIPVIADDYVDAEFGTGCVKITPAHDFNDYEVGKRHDLEMINILTVDAKINEVAPEQYRGLDRFKARKQIIKDLEDQGLLEKIEPHKLMIPRGDRSGVVIEPFLTEQWYVSTKVLAEPAIAAVKSGKIKFVPKNWENTYFNWMNEIQDWCISRQLWWGHRIPAWYDEAGNIYVGYDEGDARKRGGIGEDVKLRQDEDVLDTWFSSGLWTFATLGWPEQTPELEKFAPSNVLVTGFDIIFFWVARMIMMTLKFMGDVPFHTVFVHGLIRDAEGEKMSKSKGNVLDPIDIIDGITLDDLVQKRTASLMQENIKAKVEKRTRKEFPKGIAPQGTDALRFTLCSLASTGQDIKLSMERIEGYSRFCNKLWNAARYVLMNTAEHDCGANGGALELSVADKWIHSQLQQTIEKVHAGVAEYRFDRVAQAIYEFLWNEYCDWYLELSKPLLWNKEADEAQLRGTRHTLVNVLDEILRLAHPIMPYITEEIWQQVKAPVGKASEKTIMLQPYPEHRPEKKDGAAQKEITWIKDVVTGVRNIRGETGIGPAKALPVYLRNGKDADKRLLNENRSFMIKLANLADITWLDNGEEFPASVQLVGELEVLVPLKDLIDRDKELSRLNKEIEKLNKTIAALEGKLGNAKFVENAPADIVQVERDKLSEQQASREKLEETLGRITAM